MVVSLLQMYHSLIIVLIFRTIIPIYIHSYEPDSEEEEEDTVVSDDEDITTTRLGDSSILDNTIAKFNP